MIVSIHVAHGDTIHWSTGEVWNGARVHAVDLSSPTPSLDVDFQGRRAWYGGARHVLLAKPIPAASREAAIRHVQRWQPGAHTPSVRQLLNHRHYHTPQGPDGVSSEVWLADRYPESIAGEEVFSVTGALYDQQGFSTRYAFIIDLGSGRLWADNQEAVQMLRLGERIGLERRPPSAASVLPGPTLAPPDAKQPGAGQPGAALQRLSGVPTAGAFVANKSSRTFHKATCGSVGRMKEDNKVFGNDREAFARGGFSPCRTCKP